MLLADDVKTLPISGYSEYQFKLGAGSKPWYIVIFSNLMYLETNTKNLTNDPMERPSDNSMWKPVHIFSRAFLCPFC